MTAYNYFRQLWPYRVSTIRDGDINWHGIRMSLEYFALAMHWSIASIIGLTLYIILQDFRNINTITWLTKQTFPLFIPVSMILFTVWLLNSYQIVWIKRDHQFQSEENKLQNTLTGKGSNYVP